MRHNFRRLIHQRFTVVMPLVIVLLLLIKQCNATQSDVNFEAKQLSSAKSHLRGYINSEQWTYNTPTSRVINSKQHDQNRVEGSKEMQHRSVEANIPTIIITPSSTFQIIMTILLSILIILQLFVFIRFFRNRSKRVLEFAQPDAICVFVACSIIATATSYLYVYVSSSFTCAIREPLLFMSVSLMGATVGGRAWRISTLVNNPLFTAEGNRNKMEQIRQHMLTMLSVLSTIGCSISSFRKRRSTILSVRREEIRRGRSSIIRVRITLAQMMRATFFMFLPQLFWQVVVLSTPTLRSSREIFSNTYLYNGAQMMTMEQYQCQSSVGLWTHCVSVFLALCPYVIAYSLNVRPKSELDLLPEMIDEKEKLQQSFFIFARVIVVSAPVIGLTHTNNPEAKVYSAICAVLALPLACCYYIAYLKLNAINSDFFESEFFGSLTNDSRPSRAKVAVDQHSTTSVLRIAEMYFRIGAPEETVQLVDKTLGLYQKSNARNRCNVGLRNHNEGNQEVALGFTKNDLEALEEVTLKLIIQLLKLKRDALERLDGIRGLPKRAKINIGE